MDIVFAFMVWMTPLDHTAALQRTTARHLDASSAAEQLAAARLAGSAHGIDPDLLLAIAWRESRYDADAVAHEKSGRVSCGVMMVTEPKGVKVCPHRTALEGYLDGAEHLRGWVNATRNMQSALLGYAGGYRLIEACKRGPMVRERAGKTMDLCSTPELRRAAWVRQERTRRSTRQSATSDPRFTQNGAMLGVPVLR
jgi:hypothetical protein